MHCEVKTSPYVMAEEASRPAAALMSDSHSELLTRAGGLFELTHDDEDVQFDSEFLDKGHVKRGLHSLGWLIH